MCNNGVHTAPHFLRVVVRLQGESTNKLCDVKVPKDAGQAWGGVSPAGSPVPF